MGGRTRLLSMVSVDRASLRDEEMSNYRGGVPGQGDQSRCSPDASLNRQQIAGQLAGAVAHDLNNLLATILGCLELMERRLDEPVRLQALVKRSSGAVERAASLTSKLAQFARRQPQPKLPTNVDALIADLMPLITSALGRRICVSTTPLPAPVSIHVEPIGLEGTLLALCLAARVSIPETGFVNIITQVSEVALTVSMTVSGSHIDQLDLAQSYRVAETAGLALETGQSAEGAEVTIVIPRAIHGASSGGAMPASASNLTC